jgi:hypothetical protein
MRRLGYLPGWEAKLSLAFAVEPGRQRVKLALLARREDLLVPGLDLLPADRLASVLLFSANGRTWPRRTETPASTRSVLG